ncbi:MAG: MBL fold metallo-hydrolase [Alphaproteobacteria bacterium]
MALKLADRWFEWRTIDDGIVAIGEPHIRPFYRCNIWLVRGRGRDALIDSGLGAVSLRAAVADLLERPVLAVATHTHFDHIGAHHEFAERAVHPAEADILARPTLGNTYLGKYADHDMLTALPAPAFDLRRHAIASAPPTRLIDEGDVVDLGDRAFEVIHLPGHSPGSIGLWEKTTGVLFSGDAIYDGPLVDGSDEAEVRDYVRTMERLRTLPVRVVHGGHFPSFGRERLIELADAYLAEKGIVPARRHVVAPSPSC